MRQIIMLFLCLWVVTGCGSEEKGHRGPPDILDSFKQNQQHTVTPHGRVRVETARKAADGRGIQYETETGETFRVSGSLNANGDGYVWGTPELVQTKNP